MFGRGWLFFFLLGGALLPYLLSSKSSISQTLTAPLSIFSTGTTAKGGPAPQPTTAAPQPDGKQVATNSVGPVTLKSAETKPRAAGEVPFVPLEQALQWRVKPAWVLGTWPRVTTTLPELELQGYRVSLVSGTDESDVAGSLTYYFDEALQLQRILFQGSTGDARRLVQFLQAQHRFQRRTGDDPSTYLYQVEQDGRALSEMKVKAAPIVRAGSPLARFEVTLEMRRPEE